MNLDELANNNENQTNTPIPQPQATPETAAITVTPTQTTETNIPVTQNIPQNISQDIPVAAAPEIAQQTPIPSAPVTNPYNVVPPQNINVTVSGNQEKITIDDNRKPKKINGFFRILTLLALLTTGGLLLLESIDVFQLNLNGFAMSQIYPIVVILSVIILFWYRGFFLKIIGLILFLGIVGGLAGIGVYHSLMPSETNVFDTEFAYNIPQAGPAVLHLNTYVGDYKLQASNTPHLLEGKYISDRALISNTGFTTHNEAYLYLQEDSNRNILQNINSNLDLDLNTTQIFDFYIKNFRGNYNLNFNNIAWKSLKIHGAVGDITLDVGNTFKENTLLEIKSVRSNIVLNIPQNVGVQLHYRQLAGSMELTNFKISDTEKNYYESINIDTAKTVLHIDVNIGVGKFKINRVE